MKNFALGLALCGLVAACGTVAVEDRVPASPPRDPAGFYPLSVRVEKSQPAVGISGVQAITQFGTVVLAPTAGGLWEGLLALNPCVNGFGVRFEAQWTHLLAGNIEREPAYGVHQKWIASPAPSNCPQQIGRTFVVNSTFDLPDTTPGDGACQASDGTCTLRAAVMESNALPGQDRIELGAATYILTRTAEDDTAVEGDLDLLDDVAMVGAGAVIDGGRQRVIDVSPTGRAVDVELRRITVRNGHSTRGGAIRNRGRLHLFSSVVRDNNATDGGGIFNIDGFVEIADSQVADNITEGGSGGGIASFGERALVVVRASSFIGNHASQSGGAVAIAGGRLEMRDSTVSGNSADGHGGGLFFNPDVTAALRNVTIVDNRADFNGSGGGEGGGLKRAPSLDGALFLSHSVIANNFVGRGTDEFDDCSFSRFISSGHNLVGVADNCKGLGASDVNGSAASPLDPRLGILLAMPNGTRGHRPLTGSPLRDVDVNPANDANRERCTRVDQGGLERPQGPQIDGRRRCDIGAIEAQ